MVSLNQTVESSQCSRCGGEWVSSAGIGQCARCLMQLSLISPEQAANEPFLEDPAQPGEEPFDYELLERIGRGGMGIVYRARQKSLNRTVALKMVALGDLATPSTLARFQREAETAARLDHPNIVSIIEVGEHLENPFIVMRFIKGRNLAEQMPDLAVPWRNKEMPPQAAQRRVAELMITVAHAVDYAHGKGVLHRDLKPSNILLDDAGVPYLTDFGLAKSLDHEIALTQTAELLGTLGYMAPEQAAGKNCSRSSDIYSLGAILYELLTGHLPFEGPRMLVLNQLLECDPAVPRLINPAVDQYLETICLKCLDKEPGRRYQTGGDLAADLLRWIRHEPILAREAGPISRLHRWSKRNPAVAALLVTLSLGVGVSLLLLAKVNHEANRKSIALDILRTESARQLQEIWSSSSPYFAIKSETLATMAGMELDNFAEAEHRWTLAFIAEGNPLARILNVAPLLHQVENRLSAMGSHAARLDVRLYRSAKDATEALKLGEIDLAQLSAPEFVRAQKAGYQLQLLFGVQSNQEPNQHAVIFSRKEKGITSLSELAGASLLLGPKDSSLTLAAMASLVDFEITSSKLARIRFVDEEEETLRGGETRAAVPLGNPFSAMTPVEAVMAGLYDAAVVREKRFLEVAREADLVALHRFKPPQDLLAATGKLPAETVSLFKLALTEHAVALQEDGGPSLTAVDPQHFQTIQRRLLRAAEFAK